VNRCSRANAGFSLIELIAVMVIIGILAAVAGVSLTPIVKAFAATRTNAETAQKAQLAMRRMVEELTWGKNFSAGANALKFQSNLPSKSNMTFVIAWESASGNLYWDSNSGSGYSRDLLMDQVVDFKITYPIGGNNVQIALTPAIAKNITYTAWIHPRTP